MVADKSKVTGIKSWPETKQTYDRLVSDGIPDQEARRLIGCIASSKIFEALKQ